MANFLEKNKTRKYLTYILIFSVLLFVYFFFLRPPEEKTENLSFPSTVSRRFLPIEIDFQILENPAFKDLQPYLSLLLPEEEIGRENPFIPLKPRPF